MSDSSGEGGAPRPEFSHARPKHGLVGPFSGRQLLTGLIVVAGVLLLLVLVTRPLGNTDQSGPRDPRATLFILGAAPANGLHAGDRPPELQEAPPTSQHTDARPLAIVGIAALGAALAFVIVIPRWVGFAGPHGRAVWPWPDADAHPDAARGRRPWRLKRHPAPRRVIGERPPPDGSSPRARMALPTQRARWSLSVLSRPIDDFRNTGRSGSSSRRVVRPPAAIEWAECRWDESYPAEKRVGSRKAR